MDRADKYGRLWIPNVEMESEEEVTNNVWHQKFILTDGHSARAVIRWMGLEQRLILPTRMHS